MYHLISVHNISVGLTDVSLSAICCFITRAVSNTVLFLPYEHVQCICTVRCMLWPSVCLSVSYRLVFCQNGWLDWAGFWHRGFPRLLLHGFNGILVSAKI